MAVVTRQTKKGPVYWVFTQGHGERVGMNRQAADRLNERRKKESKAGTFRPVVTGGATVRSFLTKWLNARENRSAELERTMLRVHVLDGCPWLCAMKMEDVRPIHAKQFIQELKLKISQKSGKPIKPKYVANVNGVMKAAFNAAILDEVIDRDVWRLAPGTISKKSEPKVPYSRDEAAALLAAADRARLTWLTLALYTGMRAGEVCGRRWRDWDRDCAPLGCLTISTQYNDDPLKTDRPRRAPVHPELAAVLRTWWDTGFEVVYLRKPRSEDLIVPAYPRPGKTLRSLTRSAAYKAMVGDCARAGVKSRGMHATRHTFISAAQRGGADQKVVELITHNASGAMIDRYTHREWDEPCKAMLCLRPYGQILDGSLDSVISGGKNTVENSSDSRTRTKATGTEQGESGELGRMQRPKRAPNARAKRAADAKPDSGQEFTESEFRAAVVEHTADGLRGVRRARTSPYIGRKRAQGAS